MGEKFILVFQDRMYNVTALVLEGIFDEAKSSAMLQMERNNSLMNCWILKTCSDGHLKREAMLQRNFYNQIIEK